MAKKYRKKNTFRNCPSTETCTPPPDPSPFPWPGRIQYPAYPPRHKDHKKENLEYKTNYQSQKDFPHQTFHHVKARQCGNCARIQDQDKQRVSASTRPALIRMGTFFLPNTGLGNIIAPSLAKTRRKRLRETTISVNI